MTRIPTRTASATLLQAMDANYARLTEAQRQLATGKRLTKMSDGPADAVTAVRLRGDEQRAGAFVAAAEDGLAMLQTQDSTLQNISDILMRVRELTVAGASSIEGTSGQVAIASELEGLRDQLVSLANATDNGRSVFGGFSAAAVQSTGGAVSFVGDTNPIERRVSKDLTVSIGTNGREVFGFDAGSPPGSDNAFAMINRIAAAVRAGDADGVRAQLDTVDARMRDVSNALASVGGRVSQIEVVYSQMQDSIVSLQTRRSVLEDVDMGAAVVDLQESQNAYQATLAVIAQLHNVSLLDFLR